MIKKIIFLSAIALVLAMGVFGTVSTTHAQDAEVEETPVVQVVALEPASLAYEVTFQEGDSVDDADVLMAQTRTRTQLQEHQDGECLGDGDQLQIRQQLHTHENAGMMGQARLRQGDGTCDGDCIPLRMGGQGQ